MATSKGIVTVRDPVARLALDSLSKHALADLVVDLLRIQAGNEKLDGEPLIEALTHAYFPIARVRNDPPISPTMPSLQRLRARIAILAAARKEPT